MCIVCVELIKQRLTVPEAESASKEMIVTAKPGVDTRHFEELNKALNESDFDKLGEILDEQTADERASEIRPYSNTKGES